MRWNREEKLNVDHFGVTRVISELKDEKILKRSNETQLKLFVFSFQTSSQVAKLENTVETLRTVLTQKIQSEAQTVS